MHVCSHTENGKPACSPCMNPLAYHKRESDGKFNQLVNNISNIVLEDQFMIRSETHEVVESLKRAFQRVA